MRVLLVPISLTVPMFAMLFPSPGPTGRCRADSLPFGGSRGSRNSHSITEDTFNREEVKPKRGRGLINLAFAVNRRLVLRIPTVGLRQESNAHVE